MADLENKTSKIELLEDFLKIILPSNYPIRFSYIQESSIDADNYTNVTENTVAIFFRSGLDGMRTVKGNYVQEYIRVILNLYTENSEEGMRNGRRYCEQAAEILNRVINVPYIDESGASVFISNMKKLGNFSDIGRIPSTGVPFFSLNYMVQYY